MTASALSRRDELVIQNLPLVKAIAMRLRASLPVHVDLEDLMNAGSMGLLDAATEFDPAKENTFRTYAKHRVRGAMLDSLRQQDWASRDMCSRHKKFEAVTRDLSEQLSRAPDDSEVAEKMGVDLIRWRKMAAELQTVGPMSASVRSGDPENTPIRNFPASEDSRPDQICGKAQLSAKLRVAIGSLSERYQNVVFMYYTKGMRMKEIGSAMNIHESRVSQIHKTALAKMASVLTASGIESSAALV